MSEETYKKVILSRNAGSTNSSNWEAWDNQLVSLCLEANVQDVFETPIERNPSEMQAAKNKALGLLRRYIDSEHATLIQQVRDPVEAYAILKGQRAMPTGAGRYHATSELLNLKHDPEDSINALIPKSIRLAETLLATCKKPSDDPVNLLSPYTSRSLVDFSVQDLVKEIQRYSILNALSGSESDSIQQFASSLAVQPDLSMAGVISTLQNAASMTRYQPEQVKQEVASKAINRSHSSSSNSSFAPKEKEGKRGCMLHGNGHATENCYVIKAFVEEKKEERNKEKPKLGKFKKSNPRAKLSVEDSDTESPQAMLTTLERQAA